MDRRICEIERTDVQSLFNSITHIIYQQTDKPLMIHMAGEVECSSKVIAIPTTIRSSGDCEELPVVRKDITGNFLIS